MRLELRGAFALPGFGGSLTPLPRLPARWDDFYRLASTPLYDTGDLRAILAAGGGIGLEPAPRADSPLPAPPPPAASRRTKAAAPQRPKSSRSRRRRRSVLRRHSGGSGAPRLVKFWIPHNLDVRRLLPRDLRRYTECANYLVHRIIYGRAMRQADRDGFVPLKVRYLRKVAPDRIEKRLRDALIDLGVIECDGIWQKGRKAMGYRMAEE